MERVRNMIRKGKKSDCYSTVVLAAHFLLQIALFVIFLIFFGIPSVEKYLAKETIVISSEEKTNGIEAPSITIVTLRKDPGAANMGWKSGNLTFETFEMLIGLEILVPSHP